MCRSLPYEIANHEKAGGDADAHRKLVARALAAPPPRQRFRAPRAPPAPHHPHGRGEPEIGEKAVTHELGDKAIVARHHARTGVLIGSDDLPHILGIEPCRQRRRANKVAEHDDQLAPLGGILRARARRGAFDDDRRRQRHCRVR
jgi:hypothetical protein